MVMEMENPQHEESREQSNDQPAHAPVECESRTVTMP